MIAISAEVTLSILTTTTPDTVLLRLAKQKGDGMNQMEAHLLA